MTTALCEYRLHDGAAVCSICGVRFGLAGGSDCPRVREAYGRSADVDLAAITRPSGSAGVAVPHTIARAA